MLSFISDMIAYVFRLHDFLYVLHWLRSPIVEKHFLTEGEAFGFVTQPTPFRHRTWVICRMG